MDINHEYNHAMRLRLQWIPIKDYASIYTRGAFDVSWLTGETKELHLLLQSLKDSKFIRMKQAYICLKYIEAKDRKKTEYRQRKKPLTNLIDIYSIKSGELKIFY